MAAAADSVNLSGQRTSDDPSSQRTRRRPAVSAPATTFVVTALATTRVTSAPATTFVVTALAMT